MGKKNRKKKVVAALLAVVVIMAATPLVVLRGAQFGGSDDAASQMVEQITGGTYVPWFTPVMETLIHGELPREVESLLFCLQTGIGVGVLAFFMGRLVERKKWEDGKNRQPS